MKYQVIWVSPRGFANEGNYVHGTEKELRDFCETFDYQNGMVSTISNHRSADAAIKNAEKLARKDRRDTKYHEICCIDSLHVSEM